MEIRFFEIKEKDLLLETIDRMWKHNHVYVRKPNVLEHFVLNTPYREDFAGKNNYSYVGMWDDKGEIIGIYGTIPQRFNVFGKSYLSETATTWLVDKERGKKVNGLLMRDYVYKKGIKAAVYFGLSIEAYQINKFYYDDYMTNDFPRWIGFNKNPGAMKEFLNPDIFDTFVPYVSEIALHQDYTVERNVLEESEWDEYYYQMFAPFTVGTRRDYQFLKWRYMQSPVLKYEFVAVRDSLNKYLGLAVIRRESIMDGKIFIGRILEFICVASGAATALANAVLKTFPDVMAWDFYCLSNITAYGLESVGFRRMPAWMEYVLLPTRFQPIDYKHVKINGAVYMDESLRGSIRQMAEIPWYLTKGDSDQDRAN